MIFQPTRFLKTSQCSLQPTAPLNEWVTFTSYFQQSLFLVFHGLPIMLTRGLIVLYPDYLLVYRISINVSLSNLKSFCHCFLKHGFLPQSFSLFFQCSSTKCLRFFEIIQQKLGVVAHAHLILEFRRQSQVKLCYRSDKDT